VGVVNAIEEMHTSIKLERRDLRRQSSYLNTTPEAEEADEGVLRLCSQTNHAQDSVLTATVHILSPPRGDDFGQL
jgi:hypothetical protein